MRKRLQFALGAAAFFVSAPAVATILPPNNLHLQDSPAFTANITEEQFHQIVNNIIAKYKPIVATHGATLKSNNLWTDGTVNASAQQSGTTWVVNMYGGLARRPEVTPDGFALVVCHELGHHLGGFPFYPNNDWAASEGQSDYFATQACARKIWIDEREENAKARAVVPAFVKQKCDESWSDTNDQNLCYRSALGGDSLAKLLGVLGGEVAPKFETADATQVSATVPSHPAAQCRLDTYFNGALCPTRFEDNLIPGRKHPQGQQSLEAEEVASKYSCMPNSGKTKGLRPLCWFKPGLEFLGMRLGDVTLEERNGNQNGSIEPGETFALHVALSNHRETPTTRVTGRISSASNFVIIENASSEYPDINQGRTEKNVDPFMMRLAYTTPCGSMMNVSFAANSEVGGMGFSKNFFVGRLEWMLGNSASEAKIPDGKYSGVISEVEVANIPVAKKARIHVDISHPNVGELRATAYAPNGDSYPLFWMRERQGKDLKETFEFDLRKPITNGKWQLRIIDGVAGKEGKLNGWKTEFAAAVCR